MNTFKNEQYTITSSLNDGTIYIEVANNISYVSYEGKFDVSAFRLSFELNEIYILINNSFAEFVKEEYERTRKDEYQLNPVIDNGMLLLNFHCIVSGFLNVEFSLKLRKKIVSGDEQLLGELNKQKQLVDTLMSRIIEMEKTAISQERTIESFIERIEELERTVEIKLSLGTTDINRGSTPHTEFFPINTKTLMLDGSSSRCAINNEILYKIRRFRHLEVLYLRTVSNHNGTKSSVSGDLNPTAFLYSDTVTKLILEGTHKLLFGDMTFINNFPNLKELIMHGCTLENNALLNIQLPNCITKFTFDKCYGENGQSSIKENEIRWYCQQHGIELVIL